MAGLQRRHNKWRAKVRVPLPLRPEYGGKEFLQKTLVALDRPTAKLEAAAWEVGLRTEWAAKDKAGGPPVRAVLRQLYDQLLAEAQGGAFVLDGDPDAYDEVTAGIGYELGKLEERYLAWEPTELRQLFDPPPKREDVAEVMLVAMFTGMRLDEIASLTRGQIKTEDGIAFVDVLDAKTEAGVRRVPLHPRLSWLATRAEGGDPAARVWPTFNREGPGKKAGADAGKEFSRFKLAKGFDSRRKVFHSFRKNFVGQLEAAGVPQNEVAQLVGHEKGFTFRVYGGGVSLQRLAEIVALIDYSGLNLPEPGGN